MTTCAVLEWSPQVPRENCPMSAAPPHSACIRYSKRRSGEDRSECTPSSLLGVAREKDRERATSRSRALSTRHCHRSADQPDRPFRFGDAAPVVPLVTVTTELLGPNKQPQVVPTDESLNMKLICAVATFFGAYTSTTRSPVPGVPAMLCVMTDPSAAVKYAETSASSVALSRKVRRTMANPWLVPTSAALRSSGAGSPSSTANDGMGGWCPTGSVASGEQAAST